MAAKEGNRVLLSRMIENNRTCHDHTSEQERRYWRWFLWLTLPLIVIVAAENLAAEFGYGESAMSWWLLLALTIVVIPALISLVWYWQRQRKHHEDQIAFHQQKISEGFTYLVVENGEQTFYK